VFCVTPCTNDKAVPFLERLCGNKLATAYFCVTFRQAIIGFAAFHFRVRDGNGWVHCGISPEIYPGAWPALGAGLLSGQSPDDGL
jgi:hypothetical protein